MSKSVQDIKTYRKKPTHKYRVVDYSKSEEVERFFYTKDEANAYVKENNGKAQLEYVGEIE